LAAAGRVDLAAVDLVVVRVVVKVRAAVVDLAAAEEGGRAVRAAPVEADSAADADLAVVRAVLAGADKVVLVAADSAAVGRVE
jgi:hypothetical protein